ncbi:hypothetical protein K8Z61_11040 [Nocardioides sp. TRM66260-LWL]|uniref:ImmA/IrrE family metallo-endopeptidase n=1 Tax=Nocardioides sp. TRM66260-LWL TaxID=2874478 RepID=UPI001CC406D5|nr:hypothetical protein [Nocardioides sp. TRM66260-LWL]MBZ5735034.1 hypothetical protein [Nocardioides sp. TRM66260-LWL]
MYHPWRALRHLGEAVTMAIEPTVGNKPAWYSPAHEHVSIRPGLLQVERRCALAHELAHRDLEHTGQCRYPDATRQTARQEKAADHLAARRLILLPDLIDALCWSDEPAEVADCLWVTERFLQARIDNLYGGEVAIVRQALTAKLGGA